MTFTFTFRKLLASTGFLLTLASSTFLGGCASRPDKTVDPNTPPMMASRPFPGNLKSVSVDDSAVDLCNGCGSGVARPDYWRSEFRDALRRKLPVRVSNMLGEGRAVDRSANHPLDMRIKLKQFHVELGFGIAKIFMVAEYQLSENGKAISSWVVPSYGASDALAVQDNTYEAMSSAINHNATAFYLRFISDTSSADAARASKELAAIDTRMREEMKMSGNPLWAAAAWTSVKIVQGAQAVGKSIDSAGASYARYCQDNADECARNQGGVGAQANLATLNSISNQTQASIDRINAQNQQYNEAVKIRKDTEAKIQADQRAYKQELTSSRGSHETTAPPSIGSRQAATSGDKSPYGQNIQSTESIKLYRKKAPQRGFNSAVQSSSALLACKLACDDTMKFAEKWVSERMTGSAPAEAKIVSIDTKQCEAMGGNPLYQRCVIDLTYEYNSLTP